jgi:hypothetical protein
MASTAAAAIVLPAGVKNVTFKKCEDITIDFSKIKSTQNWQQFFMTISEELQQKNQLVQQILTERIRAMCRGNAAARSLTEGSVGNWLRIRRHPGLPMLLYLDARIEKLVFDNRSQLVGPTNPKQVITLNYPFTACFHFHWPEHLAADTDVHSLITNALNDMGLHPDRIDSDVSNGYGTIIFNKILPEWHKTVSDVVPCARFKTNVPNQYISVYPSKKTLGAYQKAKPEDTKHNFSDGAQCDPIRCVDCGKCPLTAERPLQPHSGNNRASDNAQQNKKRGSTFQSPDKENEYQLPRYQRKKQVKRKAVERPDDQVNNNAPASNDSNLEPTPTLTPTSTPTTPSTPTPGPTATAMPTPTPAPTSLIQTPIQPLTPTPMPTSTSQSMPPVRNTYKAAALGMLPRNGANNDTMNTDKHVNAEAADKAAENTNDSCNNNNNNSNSSTTINTSDHDGLIQPSPHRN